MNSGFVVGKPLSESPKNVSHMWKCVGYFHSELSSLLLLSGI